VDPSEVAPRLMRKFVQASAELAAMRYTAIAPRTAQDVLLIGSPPFAAPRAAARYDIYA